MAKNKGGRPSDFKEEYIDLAYKFCLLGATDKTLAKYFDVCEATIYNWKASVPEFLEAIQNGKEKADAEVAEALYNRAKGFSTTEEKVVFQDGQPETVTINKHYPPDTAAAFIWLKNRKPKAWRDKKEIEHQGNKDQPLTFEVINADKD